MPETSLSEQIQILTNTANEYFDFHKQCIEKNNENIVLLQQSYVMLCDNLKTLEEKETVYKNFSTNTDKKLKQQQNQLNRLQKDFEKFLDTLDISKNVQSFNSQLEGLENKILKRLQNYGESLEKTQQQINLLFDFNKKFVVEEQQILQIKNEIQKLKNNLQKNKQDLNTQIEYLYTTVFNLKHTQCLNLEKHIEKIEQIDSFVKNNIAEQIKELKSLYREIIRQNTQNINFTQKYKSCREKILLPLFFILNIIVSFLITSFYYSSICLINKPE